MLKKILPVIFACALLFSGCASLGKRAVSREAAVKEEALRQLAAESAMSKSDAAVELISMLKTPDFQDKESAVEALACVCKNSKEASGLVISCFKDNDPAVRVFLEEAVVRSGAAAVPALIEGLASPQKYVRLHCAYALGSAVSSKEAIAPLILALSDNDGDVGSASRDSLVNIGRLDHDALLLALKSDNSGIRYRVAFVIGRIGEGNEKTIAALVGLLSDKVKLIRASAVDSLVRLASADEKSADILIEKMNRLEDDQVRVLLTEAFGRSGSKYARLISAVSKNCGDSSPAVRSAAAAALPALEPDSPEAAAGLIALLGDSDGEVRASAAKALGSMGVSRREAVTALIRVFSDKYVFARNAAQASVSRLAQVEPDFTVSALMAAESNTDKNIRANAVLALGSIGSPSAATVRNISSMLNDPESDVRKAAVSAIGNAGPQMKEAVPGLIPCLKDKAEDVRKETSAILEKSGYQSRDTVLLIASALSDPDPEFRISIEQILFRIGPAAISALVAKLDDKNAMVRESLVRVLGRIGRTVPTIADGVKKINVLLRDPEKNVRLASTIALGDISMNNRESISLLIENMRDKDKDIRYYSILALGKIGPDSREASPFLVGTLKEDDNKLRTAARDALVLIGDAAVDSLIEALKESDLMVRSAAVDALDKIGTQKAKEALRIYKAK